MTLGDYKYYNKWIKRKLLELKKEIPSEGELHRTFEKEYKNSKYYKPLLNLYSLSVSFNCKGKYHLFHIPFEFLPLFYYQNMSYLKYILISIFKFDNNFEDILIDFDEIIHILTSCKEFCINEDNKTNQNTLVKLESHKSSINFTTLLNTQKMEKRVSFKKLNMNYKYIKKGGFTPKSSMINKKNFRTLNKKDMINSFNSHDDINNSQDSPKLPKYKNAVKIEEKNIYKCIYNKFLFKWHTPKYNYDITVKTPEAIFQAGRIIIKAYIDIELIFYLLENKFKNWDLYISQYIFSYKECHKNMNDLISIKSTDNLFINEFNSLPHLQSSLSTRDIREIYTNNNKINNLNKEKINQFSDKSKKYEFLYTNKENYNYIKLFHSFFITSKCKDIIKRKFCFDFNFYHMKTLNKILRIQGLKYFLKKLIYIDRQTLSLRFKYDELSSLANDQYKILEKYEPNISGTQTSIKMKERNKDIIKIVINFPVLETIKYNNQSHGNCFESDYDRVIFDGISLDTLDELCKNDFNEWPNILLK